MEREIKFRAWDIVDKKMIDTDSIDCEFYWPSFNPKLSIGRYLENGDWEQDLPIMEYTGFKDSDGKEIYEGDLIRFYDKFLYEVRYEDAKFVCYNRSRGMDVYKWGNLHRFFDPDFKGYDIQVITTT